MKLRCRFQLFVLVMSRFSRISLATTLSRNYMAGIYEMHTLNCDTVSLSNLGLGFGHLLGEITGEGPEGEVVYIYH